MQSRGNVQPRNSGGGQRRGFSFDTFESATRRNRDHHYAGSSAFPLRFLTWQFQRMTQQQFLQSQVLVSFVGNKTQRSRTQSTDRSRRNLKGPDTVIVDPKLGVNRAVRK